MENHVDLIKAATLKTGKGLHLVSLKQDVAAILKDAHSNLSHEKFKNTLMMAEKAFSEHCGCAEELRDLESILDDLYDAGIINKTTYRNIISKTACNRWM